MALCLLALILALLMPMGRDGRLLETTILGRSKEQGEAGFWQVN
jgi:hypothetical protein